MSPPAPLKVEVDTSDAVMLAVSMRRGIDPTAPGTLSKRFGALLLARTMAAAPVRTGLYRSKMRLVATSTRGGDSTVTVSNDSPQTRRLEYGFKGVDSLGRRYCVDMETEALTRDGWKPGTQLAVGDDVFSLNPETWQMEWTPVLAVNVFEGPHEGVIIKGRTLSAVVTPDHRWLVERYYQRGKRWVREWRRTDALATNMAVPLTQKRGDDPHFQTVDDDIVELAAWFWTEGSYGWSRQTIDGERQVTDRPICLTISQSPGVNPANCARIEALLTRIFGPPGPFATGAHWHTHFNAHSGSNTYKIDRVGCWLLENIAARPSKALNPRWLCGLTVAQLEMLIDVSMMADGHETPEGHRRLSQANEDRTRSFEMACALAGQPTVTRVRRTKNPNHADEWHTTLLRSARSHAIGSALRKDRPHGTLEPTVIDGPVWCPTTGTGTWLARRDGTVYVTGNSQQPRPHFGPALERTAAEYEEALAQAALAWLDRVIEARGRKGSR